MPITSLVGECGNRMSMKQGTKKKKWYWDSTHHQAYDHIKKLINHDVMLAYPNFNKVFET